MPTRRTIWTLTDTRAGDLAQLRHIVRILRQDQVSSAWQFEEKHLAFRPGWRFSQPLAMRRLDLAASALDVTPPWPDAVLAVERSAAWIGAELKRRSGGATRLVILGRMAGDPSICDLVLATRQFAAAEAPNIVMLPVPLAPAALASEQATQQLRENLTGMPRPWTLWAIGGSVPPDRLDALAAEAIITAMRQSLNGAGTRLVFTSPRTGAAVEQVLRDRLSGLGTAGHAAPPCYFEAWQGRTGPNLFQAALAAADKVVATSDSLSMVSEAIDAGKPVSLFRLPQSNGLPVRIGRALARDGALARMAAPLLRQGIIEAPPDRSAFFASLIATGQLAEFPAFSIPAGEPPLRRSERIAVSAIHRLLA